MQRYVQLISVAFYYLNWVSRTFSVMMQRYVQLISVAFYCLNCRLIVLHFHVLHLCECLIFNTFRTRFSWTSLSDLQTYLNTSKGFLFVCVWFRFFFVCVNVKMIFSEVALQMTAGTQGMDLEWWPVTDT